MSVTSPKRTDLASTADFFCSLKRTCSLYGEKDLLVACSEGRFSFTHRVVLDGMVAVIND